MDGSAAGDEVGAVEGSRVGWSKMTEKRRLANNTPVARHSCSVSKVFGINVPGGELGAIVVLSAAGLRFSSVADPPKSRPDTPPLIGGKAMPPGGF